MINLIHLFAGQGNLSADAFASYLKISSPLQEAFTSLNRFLSTPFPTPLSDIPSPMPTQTQQPLQTIASLAIYQSLFPKKETSVFAGFSLGEWIALCAAGALTPETLIPFIQIRSLIMDAACRKQPNQKMVAVIAKEVDPLIRYLEAHPINNLYPANFNSSRQIVFAGTNEAFNQLQSLVESEGSPSPNARLVTLETQGAFHSPFMQQAEDLLAPYIQMLPIQAPCHPFFSSISGKEEKDPEHIRALLLKQLTKPVLWKQTMQAIVQSLPKDTTAGALEYSITPMLQGFWKKDVPQIPIIQALNNLPTKNTSVFQFSENDPIYKHHFEGYPIVPGSLLLESLETEIKKNFASISFHLQKIKYPHFTQPAIPIRCELNNFSNKIKAILYQNDAKIAEATYIISLPFEFF